MADTEPEGQAGGDEFDVPAATRSARALRERLLSDPHRPGYHFVVPEGRAMPFDPNGAIFWKGRYHLFYIFQDERGHDWGHVSSTDLFHWRHHPTGLAGGMFSGNCFLNKEGRPTMCYHCEERRGNAMAVALDDNLDNWKKLALITPETSPGDPHHERYRSWDPFGWLEGDTYYAIFGGERPGVAKCDELEGEWRYVGDLMGGTVEGVSIEEDVSCADLFKISGKLGGRPVDRHMLLCISHRLGCRYYLGRWENEQFHPEHHEKMSWVDRSFFAPESLLDERGRRIMWAWTLDGPSYDTRMDFGWSGTMSLPRVLSLGDDGMLRMRVPEEIEALRYDARRMDGLTVAAGSELELEGVSGASLELAIEMEAPGAERFGVRVLRSPGGEEETLVFYDAREKKLKIDTTRSGPKVEAGSVEAGPFELGGGDRLELRVFVDKSVVEVFANDRQAVMRRVYPSRVESTGVALFAEGAPASAPQVEAWRMMPSNPY